MKRIDWWKFFRLPSPKELGWSDTNALASKMFPNHGVDEKTWEDWEEKMRSEYPVRYFLGDTLPRWFSLRWKLYVKDPIYWVKCHTLPSYRFHMLDLRQSKKEGPLAYRYGWIDSDTKMVYALVKILNDFVEHEMSHWYCPSEEDVQADTSLLYQRNKWLETKALHYWWNVERLRQQKNHDDLLHRWSDARKVDAPETQQLWDDLKKIETALEDKEEEMLIRLIKVRRSLWT